MKGKNTKLTPHEIFRKYSDGLGFNARINLDHEVENNENFFVGE